MSPPETILLPELRFLVHKIGYPGYEGRETRAFAGVNFDDYSGDALMRKLARTNDTGGDPSHCLTK